MLFEVLGTRNERPVRLHVEAADAEEAIKMARRGDVHVRSARVLAVVPHRPATVSPASPQPNPSRWRGAIAGYLALALLAAGSVLLLALAGEHREQTRAEPSTGAAGESTNSTVAVRSPRAGDLAPREDAADDAAVATAAPATSPPPAPTEAATSGPAAPVAVAPPRPEPTASLEFTESSPDLPTPDDDENQPYDGRPRDGWLSTTEREVLTALGSRASVNGIEIRKETSLQSLAAIADTAPPLLARRLQAMLGAVVDARPTDEEQRLFQGMVARTQQAAQSALLGGLLDALCGSNSFDTAVGVTNATMRDGQIIEAWRLQRVWRERALAAGDIYDQGIAWILDRLAERETDGKASECDWRIIAEAGQVFLEGRLTETPIEAMVLQINAHRHAPTGEWTAVNGVAGLLSRGIGITEMTAEAQAEGVRLAAAQEAMAHRPWQRTTLLTDLPAAAVVRVPLLDGEGNSLGSVERVELRVVASNGSQQVASVEGLQALQLHERWRVMIHQRAKAVGRPSRITPIAELSRSEAVAVVEIAAGEARSAAEHDPGLALRLLIGAKALVSTHGDLVRRCSTRIDQLRAAISREHAAANRELSQCTTELNRLEQARRRAPRDQQLSQQVQLARQKVSAARVKVNRLSALLDLH